MLALAVDPVFLGAVRVDDCGTIGTVELAVVVEPFLNSVFIDSRLCACSSHGTPLFWLATLCHECFWWSLCDHWNNRLTAGGLRVRWFCFDRLTVTGFVVVVEGKGAWCVVALLMTLVFLSNGKSSHT